MCECSCGWVLSSEWCAENAKKVAVIGGVAYIIGLIPTPVTTIWGNLIGGAMTLISLDCAYS